jgi:hypothetical protein
MVNHVRTLLVNRTGHGNASGPGEEYTSPAYREVPLSTPLRAIRAALFGRDPDRDTLLFRVRQFLAVLHSTELAEYVTADDPRLTYVLGDESELLPSTAASPVGHAHPLYIGGTQPREGGTGKTRYRWDVEILA